MSDARGGRRRRAAARAYRVRPIGFVRSPFKNPEDFPPPAFAPPRFLDRVKGEVVVFDDFTPGLESLDGFSHLIIIFAFHRASGFKLRTVPPGQSRPRGIFATRSPHRPNLLGLSVVRLIAREGPVLKVSGLDMIDGTPVLDIKPYTRRDRKSRSTSGWQAKRARPAR
jgi:tRNA-Thr(GGU) m(6)t(6)A37 methyltransferase TsaA